MLKNNCHISCEFYPPKTEDDIQKLVRAADHLNKLQPLYFSMTCGAGGSSHSENFHIIKELMQNNTTSIMPHVTCIDTTKQDVLTLLKKYHQLGIKRILALRGDISADKKSTPNDFKHACDLVKFIRENFNDHFDIAVATYPEKHPESKTKENDFKHFKYKVSQGADFALTQYFFEPACYVEWMEQCEKHHVSIPIIPGILPIQNWERLVEFSKKCQATLPSWLCKKMEGFNNDKASIRAYGIEVISSLCEALIKYGAPGLHFYSLNQSKLTLDICKNLGLIQ